MSPTAPSAPICLIRRTAAKNKMEIAVMRFLKGRVGEETAVKSGMVCIPFGNSTVADSSRRPVRPG